ncbi:hypothetical protein [Christiangramia sp.]|uniref:hypothetical protein n=1 Tax=Christiangramia sp. TaxID=1931228 RepID=UPI0026137630|nr:hypothetical protein [Christiangramia sp.]
MCFIFWQGSQNQKIIIIDPGHDGNDSVAIGINGIQVLDIVMEIAKKFLELNEKKDVPLVIYFGALK